MTSAKSVSRFIVLALILGLGSTLTNAQSLKLGLKGGFVRPVPTNSLDLPIEDLGHQDVYTRSNFGFGFDHFEPQVGFEIRFSPFAGGLTFAADASYSSLSGTGGMSFYAWAPDPPMELSMSSHLSTVSAGAQWSFLSGPIKPYAGARVLWTRFRLLGLHDSELPIYGFDYWGLALLGGATIDLTSLLALDIGARYHFTRIGDHQGENPWLNSYFNSLTFEVGLFFELL